MRFKSGNQRKAVMAKLTQAKMNKIPLKIFPSKIDVKGEVYEANNATFDNKTKALEHKKGLRSIDFVGGKLIQIKNKRYKIYFPDDKPTNGNEKHLDNIGNGSKLREQLGNKASKVGTIQSKIDKALASNDEMMDIENTAGGGEISNLKDYKDYAKFMLAASEGQSTKLEVLYKQLNSTLNK